MEINEYLIDEQRGEKRFRIKSFLNESDSYQIALAEDTAMDDKLVCVKTIHYDANRTEEKEYIDLRRKALKNELNFLAESCHLLPEPLDWIKLDSETSIPSEPVLVYEYMHGDNLFDLVQSRYPKGMNPNRALRFIREIAIFLQTIHRRKYVFRDLDPRHIIVGFDDIIHVVGCGNALHADEKLNPEKFETNPVYTAPEIRNEMSGKLIKPACDVYSLGALFSFLLTGIEPKSNTESPFPRAAYDRLIKLEDGIQLIVARLMMPMAKQRFGNISRLLPYLNTSTLPKKSDKGFGLIELPKPWTGNDSESRPANSSISNGPLLSVDKEKEAFIKSKLKREESSDVDETSAAELDNATSDLALTEEKEVAKSESKELTNAEKTIPTWLVPLAVILVLAAAGLVVMFAF